MRTQVHDWMIKGTTKSLSALCANRVQSRSVRLCHGSEIQQGSCENIHQVPGAEVKTIQRLLICRVLWSQGLLAQVEAQDGGGRLSTPLTRLTLSWVWV